MIDKIICWWFRHDWTCDAEVGIGPPDDEVNLPAFFRYARMWCKRCLRYGQPSVSKPGSEYWDASVKYHAPVQWFMVNIQPWAVYVKERKFFVAQGGDVESWGENWKVMAADSIEDARSKGIALREKEAGRIGGASAATTH